MTVEQAKSQGILYDRLPDGWKIIKGAMTAPSGYIWIHNGKSLFGGEYKHGIIAMENLEEEKR